MGSPDANFIYFGKDENHRWESTAAVVLILCRRRVFRMVKGGTEIFCELDQKNSKRKSYKHSRVKLKSVLNSENIDE